jgi:pimeloyl-ACP methyl ester carboxylesterase
VGGTIRGILQRVAVGLLVLILIAAAWLAFRESRRERRLTDGYSPPGAMISIGTHRLHMYCQGTGSPPVLLEAGSGLAYTNWHEVQDGLTPITTTCSYDRSGLGWSETGPTKPSANQAAAELDALLEASGIAGPWILVGHSLGGLYASQVLNLHPERVAALVLLDSPHERLYERSPLFMELVTPRLRDRLAPVLLRLGFHRRSRPEVPESDPTWVARELHATAKHLGRANAEWWAIPASARQVADSLAPWGDTPVLVMQAGRPFYPETWSDSAVAAMGIEAGQREIAARSTRGEYRLLDESGHGIPWEHPEEVIEAVSSLVVELRTSGRSARR